MASLWLLLCACLLPAAVSARFTPLIVGGKDVPFAGKYPHQASLQFMSGSHACGAALISDRWLITAAHCTGNGAVKYRIALGLHNRKNLSQGKPRFYEIERITNHPQYVASGLVGFPNDIALIKLKTPATLDAYTQPIQMAPSNAPNFVGHECHITGWGKLSGTGPLADVLQEAPIGVITQEQCKKTWSKLVGDYHICVQDGKTNACAGDSGGPLVCKMNGEFVLAGVTSWGHALCARTHPTAYSRISYFRDWIKLHTRL